MMRITALLLLLSGWGCASSLGTLRDEAAPLADLSVGSASYAPADSVVVTVTPFADIGYGSLCKAFLDRFDGERWERYRGESQYTEPEEREASYPGRVCTDILILGRAGRPRRYPIRLSDRVEPGTYRFRHRVSLMRRGDGPGRTDTLATEPFEVQR